MKRAETGLPEGVAARETEPCHSCNCRFSQRGWLPLPMTLRSSGRTEKVVYFHGHLPVFQHEEKDVQSFRLFTSSIDRQWDGAADRYCASVPSAAGDGQAIYEGASAIRSGRLLPPAAAAGRHGAHGGSAAAGATVAGGRQERAGGGGGDKSIGEYTAQSHPSRTTARH
jgi:hypothetical protein